MNDAERYFKKMLNQVKQGVTPGYPYKRLEKHHIVRLYEMKREGYSHRQIADELGVEREYIGMIVNGHRRQNDTLEILGDI